MAVMQVRKKWHNKFKGKNLKLIIFYPQSSHSVSKEKSKALEEKKTNRIQHHQTSFTTNAKGTSLQGKEKDTTSNKKIVTGKAH